LKGYLKEREKFETTKRILYDNILDAAHDWHGYFRNQHVRYNKVESYIRGLKALDSRPLLEEPVILRAHFWSFFIDDEFSPKLGVQWLEKGFKSK